MQRKDLALRVLSTAAIMSIVTSIAAPAFADIYYIGNGSIDVETVTDANGEQYVKVTQGKTTYTDTSDEIVIKDGTSEKNTTQIEESRIDGKKANVAVPDNERTDTQELETAGSADAAGESQPDPDDAFTLSEEEEDSAQTQDGKDTTKKDEDTTEPPTDNPTEKPTENPTDDPTANPKKDVVYQYDSVDPEPEQQATKLAPTTFAAPTAETKEATLDDAPTTTAPAEGSAKKPTTNVIRVINNWAERVLNIRLSNVNIKQTYDSKYADGNKEEHKGCVSGMTVKGSGNTKMELDGQNVLDGTDVSGSAGLYKDNGDGWLTITDETDDKGKEITSAKTGGSGSLSAKASAGGNGGAAIGGVSGRDTKNIIIEGYATVNASGSNDGAGIGGGGWSSGCGNAENIIIRGHSNVTATAGDGAAIGGGSAMGYGPSGSATGIQIYGHATVNASTDGDGAAIGAGGHCAYGTNAKVTIGTAGATAEQEDVHVTATSSYTGAAIGNGKANTTVIIQGHTTIENASSKYGTAIGGNYYPSDPSDPGDTSITTSITIRDNATIKKAEASNSEERPVIGASYTNKLVVNIEGNAHLGTVKGVIGTTGSGVKDAVINIKDNAHIDTIEGGINAIGGESGSGKNVTVNIDGGKNGNVELGKVGGINGKDAAISGTKVNIGDNVLLKMRQSGGSTDAKYINVNNAEAEVGTRSDDPTASGLVNTIGANTELWYLNEDNRPQKIVHGKNVCAHVPGKVVKKVDATCTEDGYIEYECNYEHENGAPGNSCGRTWKVPIPKKGHTWGEWVEDTAAGTRTHECSVCHARETEALPADTNSALELRVVDAEGMNEPFTVSENGTLRTYTGAYDTATLTGDLNTLRYLQDHGAQTIQFVTNGQTSSFAINDLLAQGSGSEVFYLTHRGAEEPTLLLVEADRSELVKD